MEQVRIRACTSTDIDGVIALERQWEQEDIAYGDFNPMNREAYIAILERFPAYFQGGPAKPLYRSSRPACLPGALRRAGRRCCCATSRK